MLDLIVILHVSIPALCVFVNPQGHKTPTDPPQKSTEAHKYPQGA